MYLRNGNLDINCYTLAMKILVTGAAGFIGSALTEELLNREHDVIGLDCFLENSYDPQVKKTSPAKLKMTHGIEVREIDLRKDVLDNVVKDVDVVVNLAAMPGLIKSWNEFQVYVDCNLLAVDRLIRNKNYSASRFIQASNSSVYGKYAIGDEATPCKPFSPYGVSKLAAENLIHAYGLNFDLKYTILRYFSVYGPGQRPDMGYSKFCDGLLRNEEITIYGDGTAKRTNTYISDCIDATVKSIESIPENKTFNICGSQQISVLEAIEVISQELEIKPKLVFEAKRPGDQVETLGDSSLASKELDFVEKVKIYDGIRMQARSHNETFRMNKSL